MAFSVSLEANKPLQILLPLNGLKLPVLCSGSRLSPQLALSDDKMKMSLPKKKIRETPTSPCVPFRA